MILFFEEFCMTKEGGRFTPLETPLLTAGMMVVPFSANAGFNARLTLS